VRKTVIPKVFYAKSYGDRLVGITGRRKWPFSRFEGLYFPDCGSVHTFFTFLRLDIVFLDKNHKILKIYPAAAPWRFFIGPPGSRHCLELPEGYSARFQLKKGKGLLCEKI